MLTTQKQIRAAFWEAHPTASREKWQGDYKTDTRMAFVDFVDYLNKSGRISNALAFRVTL